MEASLGRNKPQIIRDPELEPFYIEKDATNYSVYETRISNRGMKGKIVKPREINALVGHYTSFQNALRRICKEKFHSKSESYDSIKSYIEDFKNLQTNIESFFSKIEL